MTEVSVRPVLAGRYELGPVIGTGGMARVHRGTDTLLGRPVAVKVFRLDADPLHAARIETESRTLASVQHPGLVAVYDTGTWRRADGVQLPFLVMELVDGPTLEACCLDGSLTVQEVAAIGADLAAALTHVHAHGIVHRDVKPANILLGTDRRPKLTDFGIARLVDSARQTQTGLMVGTAAYLSPEQVKGHQVGPPTDVYALGLVLLEAATGRREYSGNNVETALARLERPPVVPQDLPPSFRTVLRQMTAGEPSERPRADEVAGALRAFAVSESAAPDVSDAPAPTAVLTEATPVAPVGPERDVVAEVARDAARNPYVLTAMLLVLFLVVMAITLATAGGNGGNSTPPSGDAPVPQLEKDLAELREAVTP